MQFISIQNSSNFVSQGSNSAATSQGPEEEPCRETIPSGLGILVSNRERGTGNDSVLQVDVVTISFNILFGNNADANDHDARRNGRRLFWDAFSRRSSRRLGDSPTIVFSIVTTVPAAGNQNGSTDAPAPPRFPKLSHTGASLWLSLVVVFFRTGVSGSSGSVVGGGGGGGAILLRGQLTWNGRRLFWDAFSRRSSRRLGDSPTIVLSTVTTVPAAGNQNGSTDAPAPPRFPKLSHTGASWWLSLVVVFFRTGVSGSSGSVVGGGGGGGAILLRVQRLVLVLELELVLPFARFRLDATDLEKTSAVVSEEEASERAAAGRGLGARLKWLMEAMMLNSKGHRNIIRGREKGRKAEK
ncbi:hypothetical protein LR48_Vigan07g060300 [Vigna angularis]|uniref:Uncharacterized protein n=1 Tax=Phaseolus angularis TaxID=3914 RepID=A0A0L9UWI6_PHAAN|nr:hypothetical protein LR48_Vigan07g060300 [Vigna angularis]